MRHSLPFRTKGRVIAASATALALLAGLVGVADAAASTPMIKGCYNTKTGALTVLTPSHAKCATGTRAIFWNQVGPRGATGPAGPKGATGAAGTVFGLTYTSTAEVPLTSSHTWSTILQPTGVPAAGTYYFMATIRVWVSEGDRVACDFPDDSTLKFVASAVRSANTGDGNFAVISMVGSASVPAGHSITAQCTGGAISTSSSFAAGGTIDIIPVSTSYS